MNLTGKIIFITGSTRGIGRELANQCLRCGAHVIIHGRNKNRVQLVRKELAAISPRVDSICADLSVVSQRYKIITHLKSSYKRIDVIVHNAAVSMRGKFANCTVGLLNNMISTNLTAPVLLTQALISLLNEKGSIMFVSSGAGLYGFPNIIPYSLTKMCLNALHQGLDIELSDRKIHVGIVYLDFVENDDEKTILNEQNRHIKVKRKARLTQEHAAHVILLAIVNRHRARYVGMGTKLVALMARYFPHLFHRLLIIRRHAVHDHHSGSSK